MLKVFRNRALWVQVLGSSNTKVWGWSGKELTRQSGHPPCVQTLCPLGEVFLMYTYQGILELFLLLLIICSLMHFDISGFHPAPGQLALWKGRWGCCLSHWGHLLSLSPALCPAAAWKWPGTQASHSVGECNLDSCAGYFNYALLLESTSALVKRTS